MHHIPSNSPIRYALHASPLGALLLASSELGLCGLHFDAPQFFAKQALLASSSASQKPSRAPAYVRWQEVALHACPILKRAAEQVDAYFAGQLQQFDIALDLRTGTAFQQEAWRVLQDIGYGQTLSYSGQAQHMGRPKAVRAVGSANGQNPVSIIVPCHRVVGMKGALTGYGGGVSRKAFLLELEQKYSAA